MVQDLVKRNFELGKEIERLQSELDDAKDSLTVSFILGSQETKRSYKIHMERKDLKIAKLKDLLKQAEPWVSDYMEEYGTLYYIDDEFLSWKKQYNELMGEEIAKGE